jgi:hypothetical protein
VTDPTEALRVAASSGPSGKGRIDSPLIQPRFETKKRSVRTVHRKKGQVLG